VFGRHAEGVSLIDLLTVGHPTPLHAPLPAWYAIHIPCVSYRGRTAVSQYREHTEALRNGAASNLRCALPPLTVRYVIHAE
jgi:hypothetical protein